MDRPHQRPAAVLVGHGPRAVEELLFEEVEAVLPRAAAELLAPVRIVVPSRSLRLHVAQRLVERRGRAVAGVVVQTLYGLALEVLGRAGETKPSGALAFEVLVRRAARSQPVLRDALEPLDDGYAPVGATARDLLDAGLEPHLLDPLREALEELRRSPVPQAAVDRSLAVIEAAAQSAAAADELGLGRSSNVLRDAAELLARDASLLPSRAVLVHGFADATGLASDLLEQLVRVLAARVLVDRPPDPLDPSRDDPGCAFAERLLGRLGGSDRAEEPPVPAPAGRRHWLQAGDPDSEVRGVAAAVAALLGGGVRPESVAIVARDLGQYATSLRRHLDRLGVPCSAVGATLPAAPLRFRCQAFLRLLDEAEATPAEVWLAALAGSGTAELLLALRTLGVGRLREVAALDLKSVADGGVELPVVGGWREREAGLRRLSHRLPRKGFATWVKRARRAEELLTAWPEQAPLGLHLERSLALLRSAGEELSELEAALAGLADELPLGWELTRDEWVLLVRRAISGLGTVPLGGSGGGVQLLTVMEARARTFDHLFLLGLARDVFPRVVQEDPLIPDAVRARLTAVLPDLPVKERGWDEERYLFAQLMAAARETTVSWPASSRGAKLAPSPFLERLRVPRSDDVTRLPQVWSGATAGVRPAFERAVLAGLAGNRDHWAAVLELAMAEGQRRCAGFPRGATAKKLASARRALVDELDPVRARADLGPLLGLIGEAGAGDPRRGDLWVTTLEVVARCPWQAFLSKLLRLEPPPDPLLSLPGADPAMVGNVVHRVLQEIVRDALASPRRLADAVAREESRVPWPSPERLDELRLAAARDVAADAGLEGTALAAVLAERAKQFLEVAKRVEWDAAGGAIPVLGAELTGEVLPPTIPLRLLFRADRVDRVDDRVVLTDYKTGAAVGKRKARNKLAKGEMLQAAAYAIGTGGRGRYLYLRPEAKENVVPFDAGDPGLADAFVTAVSVLSAAWLAGALVPRMADRGKDSGGPCDRCEVRQACLRDDSGVRRRLLEWQFAKPTDRVDGVAHDVWWLGGTAPEPADGNGEEEG